MSFTPIRISLRAALLAGAALLLGAAFSLSAALAQIAPEQSASLAPDRAHIEEVLKGLNRGHSLGQVAISPDGKRLAWIEGAREGAEIRVAPLGDLANSERVTAATKPEQHCHEGQIAWSPNAKSLVFFSDCAKPDQPDLYLSRLDGSPARRLTELKGYVEAPAFSPDGNARGVSLCGRRNPAGRGAGGHEAAVGSDRRGWRRDSAGGCCPASMRQHPGLLHEWPLLPICTSTSLIGGRTRRDWPTSPPIRPERTTGGWQSSIRRS